MIASPANDKAIAKYLSRHAEPVADYLHDLLQQYPGAWQQALVIPAYKEGDGFVRRLLLAEVPCPTLFVLVFNGPEAMDVTARADTLRGLDYLQCHTEAVWQHSSGFLQLWQHRQQFFLGVNLLEPPSPALQQTGVGFARKLGTDICLWLYAHQRLQSPWVKSTDADVRWPAAYFCDDLRQYTGSVLIHAFRHVAVDTATPAPEQHQAAGLYDAWLRYYVAGLRWSGSPWAFHTIGSTLAIHLYHYAVQRGFPKRDAGEDFYLLNKLAKTGAVIQLQQPVLELSNRISDRTPFGTGIAIGRIAGSGGSDWHWPFYHPAIFTQLKIWHEWMPQLHDMPAVPASLRQQPVYPILQQLGLDSILQHCRRQCRDAAAFTRHLWQWFDAATTRKCVHALRDYLHQQQNTEGTLDFARLTATINAGQLPFVPAAAAAITTPVQLSEWLTELAEHFPKIPPDYSPCRANKVQGAP